MATSPYKQIIVDIHENAALISNNNDRKTEPYFKYGDRDFNNLGNGRPPQVRWRPTEGTFTTDDAEKSGIGSSGSLGFFKQTYDCSIWAADESSLFTEKQIIFSAIVNTNPQGLDDISYSFFDNNGNSLPNNTEVVSFSITLPIDVASLPMTRATILTSSYVLSTTSSISLTGSMWRDIDLT